MKRYRWKKLHPLKPLQHTLHALGFPAGRVRQRGTCKKKAEGERLKENRRMETSSLSPLGRASYYPPLEGAQGEEINKTLFLQKNSTPLIPRQRGRSTTLHVLLYLPP